MLKIQPVDCKRHIPVWFFLVVVWLSFPQVAQAQRPEKKDYIVVADTALSQGKVLGIPSEDNTVVYFSRSRRNAAKAYTVAEVSEFRVSERLFFAKKIPVGGSSVTVFLEKLTQEVPQAKLWKLNGKPSVFYLETADGMEALGEDYRKVLGEALGNDDLLPLLAITDLSELSLNYLSKTAKSITKPRTFTRRLTLSPWVGYASQTVGFTIPETILEGEIAGVSPAFGIHGELFLTFKRNLSIGAGLAWSQFDSQNFFSYTSNQFRYESDIFMDFTLLQVPVLARYYYDLKPNSMRIFVEAGYSYAIPAYEKIGIFQAKFERNTIVTSRRAFEMSESYSAFTWGIGLEKYLSKHRGVVLGLRQTNLTGVLGETVTGLVFHLGFKF